MAQANNAKKEKFTELLHELFQLNQPELDFGLYRIMHAKSAQIKSFIESDLAREIDNTFAASGNNSIAELKAAYESARTQAVEFGIAEPDGNPKVQAAKAAYDAARDNGNDPADIYDHLYRFFSRYYDKGDFLSRRYHVAENDSRAAPYAVPYDGREVYLHWANKDQYYIKSSETLTHFSFDLSEAIKKEQQRAGKDKNAELALATPTDQRLKVQFKLVEASEGAHNNVKENQCRFFIIHEEAPVVLLPLPLGEYPDGHKGRGEGGDTQTLTIQFQYRYDPEKSGQDATWQKKRMEEAEAAILKALKSQAKAKAFIDGLSYPAPTDNQKDRTLLGKYLTRYTARNTMDYFIHKDLGGFLKRELDFYIKNEIMRLDDIENAEAPQVEQWLGKVKALRTIARQIIRFLTQVEEFQKKLWLKKKFVTETNYCITLDRVPQSLYPQIAANAAQREEWVKLFAINEIKETKGDLAEPGKPGYSAPLTVDFLKSNPYLVLDTALFEDAFKAQLLASVEGLDEQCDGVLLHSDNFQALKFVYEQYKSRVKYIYIDPPYNTDSTPILYKNSYKDSSWLSLMEDRMKAASGLLSKDGVKTVAIDDTEMAQLSQVMADLYPDYRLSRVTVVHNPKGSITKAFNRTHEYALFLTKEDGTYISRALEENKTPRKMRRWGENSLRTERRLSFYPIYVKDGEIVRIGTVPADDFHPSGRNVALETGEIEIWPIDQDGVERRWNFGLDSIEENTQRITVLEVDETLDLFLTHELTVPKTVWSGGDYDAGNYGNTLLINILGEKRFDFPKSIKLVERCISLSVGDRETTPIVLDYFGGSGTTGHAAINHMREGKQLKYCLVEMGEHFNAVIKPRLQKVVYSKDWKEGKPLSREGISHCFKYLRLESYEDTLNNLVLDEDEARSRALSEHDALRRDYLLNYFLDVETRGSASLLNVQQFRDPTAYVLKVKKPGSESYATQAVDLIETFNWLIGLEVARLDRPRLFEASFEREHDPELPEDQHTRLKVTRFKEQPLTPTLSPEGRGSDSGFWFRTVEGYVRRTPGSDANRAKVLVIWRKLTDDAEKDAAALEAFLDKLRVNQADSEFDLIYLNGPHGLLLTGAAKARVLSLEETFMNRMWEGAE